MQIIANGKTDRGNIREHNEDSFCIEDTINLYAVTDGVGGLDAGEVASKMAIDVIRDYINKAGPEDVPETENCKGHSKETGIICRAIKFANSAVYETANTDPARRMGTTIAAALINKNRLSIAHAGDSRVYLVRDGRLEQLTDDHSIVNEQDMPDDIADRFKNVITRALGTHNDVEVDLDEMTLFNGDILMICSDGLTSMVPDNVILSTIETASDPEEACDMLVKLAKENGGKDNITVIVIRVYKKKVLDYIFQFVKKCKGE